MNLLSASGEERVIKVVEVDSKSNTFNILMEVSTIHSIVSIRRIHEMREFEIRNSNINQLLNLLDVQDISVNADALQDSLNRSFYFVKEHCINDNVLKKFISIYTEGASMSIEFNDCSFPHQAEEYSDVALRCIFHQLELAIKEHCVKSARIRSYSGPHFSLIFQDSD